MKAARFGIGKDQGSRARRWGWLLLTIWVLGQAAMFGHGLSHRHLTKSASAVVQQAQASASSFQSGIRHRVALSGSSFTASVSHSHTGSPTVASTGCEFCQLLTHLVFGLPAAPLALVQVQELRAPFAMVAVTAPLVPHQLFSRGRSPPSMA